MKHALVVGGTGMLADVVEWLAKNGYFVSVIGRDARKMNQLLHKNSRIKPILVNYRNEEDLQEKLDLAIQQDGAFDLIVAWVRSDAQRALEAIMVQNSGYLKEWKLRHVLNSGRDAADVRANLEIPELCHYSQVQLGFMIENESSRWLTNEEISSGVIKAIQLNQPYHLVGVMEPVEKRP
ncbi:MULTISPECIES: short-chain dehydrogenase [unclassified Bacillus (in: firmicutes)]|uniref:short-chain dehydrogenase n=1 Tax=unclassified Bacillus (in: firmicutes) TaxID=185979 RepID=UPI0008E20034|nr:MULTISPECIES: short-chain dehydrogenase [unclassified Bacillus (in: firmicutes)]SFA85370.1 hypothetical protein SAMN02799634_10221 [Bacillus sp. UNCCL13]SFQ83388.1 hypothetical protein SAMN04488577_2141 [Bacillus sp. cl95]